MVTFYSNDIQNDMIFTSGPIRTFQFVPHMAPPPAPDSMEVWLDDSVFHSASDNGTPFFVRQRYNVELESLFELFHTLL